VSAVGPETAVFTVETPSLRKIESEAEVTSD
jgi:hypothetical protein